MKFHCPECNAKYRISEDKISSRPNAKLRCKQCSHLFVVREAVEKEARNPTVSIAPGADPEHSMAAKTPATARRPLPGPPVARAAARPQPKLVAKPPPMAPGQRTPLPGSSSTGRAVALSPVTAGAADRPVPGKLPKPSVPPPPSALAEKLEPTDREERSSAVNDTPSRPQGARPTAEPSDSPPSSSVRGSSVPNGEAQAADLEGWFIEADGAPEGPLTEKRLRDLVSEGSVDPETLVWRENAGDWTPAKDVKALSVLWAAAAEPKPESIQPAGAAEKNLETDRAASPLKPEPPVAKPPPNLGQKKPVVQSAVPALATPSTRTEVSVSSGISLSPGYLLPQPGKTVPAMLAWGASAAALVFGFGLGYLTFAPKESGAEVAAAPKNAPELTDVGEHAPPPPPREAPATEREGEKAAEAKAVAGESTDLAAAVAGNVRADRQVSPRNEAAKPNSEEKAGGSLLSGLGPAGAVGPTIGGNSRAVAGPSLQASQIQQAVQRYQPGVRRSCWQRALNGRPIGAPTSARVTVTINIAPSGSVTGVTTSGDPSGYPGLAGCIQSRVRSWQFPSAGGGTTTKVPFVFAAQ